MSGVLRSSLCRLRPLMNTNVQQKASFVFGPPKYRIPITEKYLLFAGAVVVMLGPSLWITLNVENYKRKE